MNRESHVRTVRHVSTMEKIKKLMLITFVFLAGSLIMVGVIGLLILFKLRPDSITIISDLLNSLGWWILLLPLIPIVSLFVTYFVGPLLTQRAFYRDIELREESVDVKDQLILLEEQVQTLIQAVEIGNQTIEKGNEAAENSNVASSENKNAVGKLRDEVRALSNSVTKSNETVNTLEARTNQFDTKIVDFTNQVDLLATTRDELSKDRRGILQDELTPVKNNIISLRKENVQLHKSVMERIHGVEQENANLNEFMINIMRGVVSAFKTYEEQQEKVKGEE